MHAALWAAEESVQASHNDIWKTQLEVDSFIQNEPDLDHTKDIILNFQIRPMFTYNPMHIVMYGLYEGWLKRLCKLYMQHNEEVSNIKRNGDDEVRSLLNYLSGTAQVDIMVFKEHIDYLELMRVMRHCITHHQANIQSYRQSKNDLSRLAELEVHLGKCDHIRYYAENGFFHIDDVKYILEMSTSIRKVLMGTFKQLRVNAGFDDTVFTGPVSF